MGKYIKKVVSYTAEPLIAKLSELFIVRRLQNYSFYIWFEIQDCRALTYV